MKQHSFLLLFALIAIVTSAHVNKVKKDKPDTRIKKKSLKQSSSHTYNNCLVNVHGLHNSGTGTLRTFIQETIGVDLMSKLENTRKVKDEGQHAQNIYPSFSSRMLHPRKCGLNTTSINMRGRLYYCPELVNHFVNEE